MPAGWRAKALGLNPVSRGATIDQRTGAWLSADVELGWSLQGGDGRRLRGSMNLVGSVTAVSPDAAHVVAPSDAVTLPERTRYEAERERLLDGLAAP